MIGVDSAPERSYPVEAAVRLAHACSVGYTLESGEVIQPYQCQTRLYKPSEDRPGYRQLSQEVLLLPSVDPGLRLAIFNQVTLIGDNPEDSTVSKRQIAMQWTDRTTADSINCTLQQEGDGQLTMVLRRSPDSSPSNITTIDATSDQQRLVLELMLTELDALGKLAMSPTETTPTGSMPIGPDFVKFLIPEAH